MAANAEQVLGALAARHSHDLDVTQRRAWEEEIEILHTLHDVDGWLYLEFDVPRLEAVSMWYDLPPTRRYAPQVGR